MPVKELMVTDGTMTQVVTVVEGDTNVEAFKRYLASLFGGEPASLTINKKARPLIPALLYDWAVEPYQATIRFAPSSSSSDQPSPSYSTPTWSDRPGVSASWATPAERPFYLNTSAGDDSPSAERQGLGGRRASLNFEDLSLAKTPLDAALEILDRVQARINDPQVRHQLDYVKSVIRLPSWEAALPAEWEEMKAQTQVADGLQRMSSTSSLQTGTPVAGASTLQAADDVKKRKAVVNWLTQNFSRSTVDADNAGELRVRRRFSSFKSVGNAVRGMVRWGLVARRKKFIDQYPIEVEPELLPELDAEFAKLDTREFNIFEVTKLTKGQPLQFILWRCLRSYNLFDSLDLPTPKVKNFLKLLESRYHEVPYHNREHAADVVQTVHFYIKSGLQEYLSDIEILAILIAAACHDAEHNGVNNAFHVRCGTHIALLHNDQSVLENHHCSVAWSLLARRDCNFIANFTVEQQRQFREMVIDMILATDMSCHVELIRDFKGVLALRGPALQEWSRKEYALMRKMLVHAADISNPTKPRDWNNIWGTRVLNEFFGQGERERELNLPVSFDPDNWPIAENQIGFFNFAAVPTFELMSQFLPALTVCSATIQENLRFWEAVRDGAEAFELARIPYDTIPVMPPDLSHLVTKMDPLMPSSRRWMLPTSPPTPHTPASGGIPEHPLVVDTWRRTGQSPVVSPMMTPSPSEIYQRNAEPLSLAPLAVNDAASSVASVDEDTVHSPSLSALALVGLALDSQEELRAEKSENGVSDNGDDRTQSTERAGVRDEEGPDSAPPAPS